jgi:hypothetical protein
VGHSSIGAKEGFIMFSKASTSQARSPFVRQVQLTVLIFALLCGVAYAQKTVRVSVRDAWIRWLPGNLPAGGYVTIVNASDQVVNLLQASSADYADVSLHQTVITNGMSTMRPMQRIRIAPKSTLQFEGSGYHLMLQHPTHSIIPGAHVVLTLRFDRGPPVPVSFEVRRPSDAAPAASSMPRMSNMPGMGR